MKPKLFMCVDVKESYKGLSFVGDLYWQFDDYFFPEEHWSDYVVEVLEFWRPSLIELILNNDNVQEFIFMDGNYALRVVNNNSILDVDCCEWYDPNPASWEPIASYTVKLRDFVQPIYLATTRLISTFNTLKPLLTEKARNRKNDVQTRQKANCFLEYESYMESFEQFCAFIKEWKASS